MPKLLQINVCCAVLSTGKIAESIGRIAKEKGWISYISYGRGFKPSVNETIKIGNKLDVIEHYIEHRLFDNDGLASRKATKRLIRRIEEIKPDIIHLHNIHDHYLNYKILLDYLGNLNIPIVWTLHDCWNFTGGCKYFDQQNCMDWIYGCKKCKYKNIIFKEQTEKHYNLLKKLQDNIKNLTFIPVSYWLNSYLKQSHQCYRQSYVIHNGVDLNVFSPQTPHSDSKYILGVAAVWNERKGLDDFYKLRKVLPEDFDIVLVGLSKKQINNLPKGIIGISRTSDQEELARLYSDALVYVNPTYADNFPTTNIESLACGTPVITYNTGGSPEAIDSETGYVREKGDIMGIIECILDIEKKGRSEYTSKCRKRAEVYFDRNKKYQEYIELYSELLSQPINIKNKNLYRNTISDVNLQR